LGWCWYLSRWSRCIGQQSASDQRRGPPWARERLARRLAKVFVAFVVRWTAVGSAYATTGQWKTWLTNIAANREITRRTAGVTRPVGRGIIGSIRIVGSIGIRRARQRRWWAVIILSMNGCGDCNDTADGEHRKSDCSNYSPH
jgi:hypothetical protein